MTKDEARRIAAGIAKLPELVRSLTLSLVLSAEPSFLERVNRPGMRGGNKELYMKALHRVLVGAVVGAGVLAFFAVNASADIVCSHGRQDSLDRLSGNTCWHTHGSYRYPRSAHIIVHPDNWRAGPNARFREHEGPGYWQGNRWVETGIH